MSPAFVERFVLQILYYFILLLELFGAAVIIYTAASIFFVFLRTTKNGQKARLTLARHLAFGLEFILGGEIIRTIVARSLEEIKILAAIIILRSILTLLIHWEIKQEQASLP